MKPNVRKEILISADSGKVYKNWSHTITTDLFVTLALHGTTNRSSVHTHITISRFDSIILRVKANFTASYERESSLIMYRIYYVCKNRNRGNSSREAFVISSFIAMSYRSFICARAYSNFKYLQLYSLTHERKLTLYRERKTSFGTNRKYFLPK